MKNRKGLGKGLDALLSGLQTEENKLTQAEILDKEVAGNGYLEVKLELLSPGRYQPRQEILTANLEPLVESIRSQGIIQPIVVRPLLNNRYEIIAGERRFRAATIAGLNTVPVIIKEVQDKNAMAMALIENIQREDLNPIEEAMAFERLAKEFNLTHIQVAEAVGKSRVTVTNSLRLLNLSDEIKSMLIRGDIDVGHAKILLGLPLEKQKMIANKIREVGLSVRETERIVTELSLDLAKKVKALPPNMDPDIRRLQNSLSEKLGAAVTIQHAQSGKGRIVVQYNNIDELEGILEHIQ